MKNYLILIILIFPILFFSCKRKGCNDNNALNYESHFRKNDGSCKYSAITFYALNWSSYSGSSITYIDMTVNNASMGTITMGYPNGPVGCNDPGTVFYQIVNMSEASWVATIHLASGGTVVKTGGTGPNHFTECIKVDVTK
jgi:hypothetical protein